MIYKEVCLLILHIILFNFFWSIVYFVLNSASNVIIIVHLFGWKSFSDFVYQLFTFIGHFELIFQIGYLIR